jgi:hypothetical protein
VNAADITMLDSESIRFTPDQLALTNDALPPIPDSWPQHLAVPVQREGSNAA